MYRMTLPGLVRLVWWVSTFSVFLLKMDSKLPLDIRNIEDPQTEVEHLLVTHMHYSNLLRFEDGCLRTNLHTDTKVNIYIYIYNGNF